METTADLNARAQRRAQLATMAALYAVALASAAGSAVLVKEFRARSGPPPALAAVDVIRPTASSPSVAHELRDRTTIEEPAPRPNPVAQETDADAAPEASRVHDIAVDPLTTDPNIRWFNGRPVRPARTIMMTVTAYSPDERSCGEFADGYTATLHSVWTNGFKLVAADTRLLPFGSLLTVPGYDNGQIVPVLDRGGAIKGHRLDVLFPTHEEALKWGVRKIPVTVWEYADGKPADDPRKFR